MPPRKSPAARRFTLRVLGSALLMLFLVAAFNLVVNPYRIFFPQLESTLSGAKPRPMQLQQELKSMLGERLRPEVLLMGNSTMEIGLDPQALSRAGVPGRIFNLGIAGFTLEQSTVGLRRVVDGHPPAVAIIGAAFSEHLFLGRGTQTSKVATETSWALSDLRIEMLSLIGSEATIDSLRTLTIPYRPYPQTLTALGFNPMRDFDGYARTSGYKVLFDTANKRIHKYLANAGGSSQPDAGASRGLNELRSLVSYLVGEGVRVVIVMNPYHADYLASIHHYGLQPVHEAWKASVAGMATLGNERTPVRVVDFGCEGRAMREPIPSRGDRQTTMRWYWDSEHYKAELGTRMILLIRQAQLDGVNDSVQRVFSDGELTGRLLEADHLASHHSVCRKAVADYVAGTGAK